MGRRSEQLVLVQLLDQRGPRHAEAPGGLALVVLGGAELLGDDLALERLDPRAQRVVRARDRPWIARLPLLRRASEARPAIATAPARGVRRAPAPADARPCSRARERCPARRALSSRRPAPARPGPGSFRSARRTGARTRAAAVRCPRVARAAAARGSARRSGDRRGLRGSAPPWLRRPDRDWSPRPAARRPSRAVRPPAAPRPTAARAAAWPGSPAAARRPRR